MKDYLAKSTFGESQKEIIGQIAKYLYTIAKIGNKNDIGWAVCDDSDRNLSFRHATEIYLDIIYPYTRKQSDLWVNKYLSKIQKSITDDIKTLGLD